jgi:integrase
MGRNATLKPRKDKNFNRASSPWWISIPPKLSETGRRQKRYFATKEAADGEALRIKIRKENHGTASKLLSPADEQQAASAFKLLRDFGSEAQLTEIVGEYLDRLRQRNASKSLSDAWDTYMVRDDKNFSRVHLKNLKATKKRFESHHSKMVADLTAAQIEKCLEGASPTYRNSMLREIRSVLNWCMGGSRKWLSSNPADECEFSATAGIGEVAIYTPDQIKNLMKAAVKKHPEIVPVLAFMTFAGIRPDQEDGEIVKLDWSHVLYNDRHHKRIELPGSITKTGKLRSVKIRPALHSWIQWHIKRIEEASPRGTKKVPLSGLVSPEKGTVLRTKIREVFVEAGVDRIQDGLRHTFASYLAPIDGLNIVETELGHQGGREILNRHYRTDVRKPVANQFWAIRAPKLKN